jgi:hypothetical protein
VTLTSGVRSIRLRPAALVIALALVLAACGDADAPTGAPPTGSATPSPSGEPGSSSVPTAVPTEEPTGEATPPPTDEPSTSPGATASPGSADACTGNDENRAFYSAVAEDVTWDVYCATLPAGWFVDAGSFRLAGGGRLEIAYKGPGGQRIEMREGAYCAGDEDCIPTGPDAGTASFGDRPARLVDAGDGDWLVVSEGGDVNWEAKGLGMDGPTLAAYTAAFALVDD